MRFVTVLFKPLSGVPHSAGIYDLEWAWKLWEGIEKHSTGKPSLALITDFEGAEELTELSGGGIEIFPFNYPERNWSSLMEMFRPEVVGDEGALLVGLDTIITGDLSNIEYACHRHDAIAPLDPYRKPDICNAAIWITHWRALEIWEKWAISRDEDFRDHTYRFMGEFSEMLWLRHNLGEHVLWDEILPGAIQSWKADLNRGNPKKDTAIVYFHGAGKPHTIDAEWIKEHWK